VRCVGTGLAGGSTPVCSLGVVEMLMRLNDTPFWIVTATILLLWSQTVPPSKLADVLLMCLLLFAGVNFSFSQSVTLRLADSQPVCLGPLRTHDQIQCFRSDFFVSIGLLRPPPPDGEVCLVICWIRISVCVLSFSYLYIYISMDILDLHTHTHTYVHIHTHTNI
jgi:hypothetical protein